MAPRTASPAVDTAAAAAFHTPVSPLRVLIVDDDHINLSILGTLLKRRFSNLLDGAPIAVDSGLKAIQALRQDVFDVVLLDVQMPGIDGVEVCKRIRAGSNGILAANSNAHVFATTTALGAAAERVYERCGMSATLPKPVRPANLASILLPLSKASSPPTLVSLADGSLVRSAVGGQHDPLPSVLAGDGVPPTEAQVQKFADDLREQTKASLRSARAMSVVRCATVSHGGRARSGKSIDSRSGSASSSDEHLPLTGSANGRRLTISARALCMQMAEEIASLDMGQSSTTPDLATVDADPTAAEDQVSTPSFASPLQLRTSVSYGADAPIRPKAIHRISAPAFLPDLGRAVSIRTSGIAHKLPASTEVDKEIALTSPQLTASPTEQSASRALRFLHARRPAPRPTQPPSSFGRLLDTGQMSKDRRSDISSSDLSSVTSSSTSSDFSSLSLANSSRRPSTVSDVTESDDSELDSPSTAEDQPFNLFPPLQPCKALAKSVMEGEDLDPANAPRCLSG